MKSTVLYRIACVLLVLFAAGNTYGVLKSRMAAGMNTAHFPGGHAEFTYAQVVLGLGLFCSLYFLFSAYLASHLGGLARTNPQAIGALSWVFFAVQLVSLVMSKIYLAAGPLILSGLIAICTGWAAWTLRSAPPTLSKAR
jgi:hypothetical protein